jgi:hypothetical protein
VRSRPPPEEARTVPHLPGNDTLALTWSFASELKQSQALDEPARAFFATQSATQIDLEDHPGSDVDLLADFPPGLSLFGLGRLEADLEGILGTRIDLIPAADLKPGVRQRVEADLIAL